MKKKIIGILVCILMLATAIFVTEMNKNIAPRWSPMIEMPISPDKRMR